MKEPRDRVGGDADAGIRDFVAETILRGHPQMDVVSTVSKQAVQRVEQTSLTTRRLVELSTELNKAVQQFRV